MLIERFKKYLEQQFRLISPTKESMEYRQEVLQNLLDRAHEYQIKGMTDEDAIYDLCIDSLGNFKSTLSDFENRLDNVKKAAPKVGAYALTAFAVALFIVVIYLAVSFATKAWDKTWLMIIGGAFAGVIAASIFGIVKYAKKQKYLPVRGFTHIIIISLFALSFFMLRFLTDLPNCWLAFLVMVVAIIIADTAEAYAFDSKTKLADLLAAIAITSVMVYVILGILGGYWHPYWLIIVCGIIVDIAVMIASLLLYSRKKEKRELEKRQKLNEEYYTMWNDEIK